LQESNESKKTQSIARRPACTKGSDVSTGSSNLWYFCDGRANKIKKEKGIINRGHFKLK
jgi:hypothetical protein